MHRFVLSLVVLTFLQVSAHSAAHAQSRQCLQQASDTELLSEVGRRMGSSGDSADDVVEISASCNSYALTIEATNETGETKRLEKNVTDSSICARFAAQINGRRPARFHRVATCSSYVLQTWTVGSNLTIGFSARNVTDASTCVQTATQINQR